MTDGETPNPTGPETEPAAEAAVPEPAPAAEPAVAPAMSAPIEVVSDVAAAGDEAPRRKRRPAKASSLQPLPPYAIITTGGKQYRVSVGDRVSVEKLPYEPGATVTFEALLVGGDGATRVGTPTVPGASVVATVEETYRGEKIIVFKYKAKKRYRRKQGHRQSLTRLAIQAIQA